MTSPTTGAPAMRIHPLLVGVAFGLTACSGSPTATPSTPPPSVPLETPAASASPTPSLSPSATLSVGATQTHDDGESVAKVAVLRVRAPLASRFPPDRAGFEYIGVEVRKCIMENTSGEKITVSWRSWSLAFSDDTIAESPSSWNPDGFSVALYPNNDRVVPTGRCVRGWIPFEVRKGQRPTTVSHQPYEGSPLEWAVE